MFTNYDENVLWRTFCEFMEYKGTSYSAWNLPIAVDEVELHEVIHRIYDEKLSEELIAPAFRHKLFHPQRLILLGRAARGGVSEIRLQSST